MHESCETKNHREGEFSSLSESNVTGREGEKAVIEDGDLGALELVKCDLKILGVFVSNHNLFIQYQRRVNVHTMYIHQCFGACTFNLPSPKGAETAVFINHYTVIQIILTYHTLNHSTLHWANSFSPFPPSPSP